MSMAAFQSSLRRGAAGADTKQQTQSSDRADKDKKLPIRRSRSVSAFSRKPADSELNDDVFASDFLIKRDNPLFCSTKDNGDLPANAALSKPKLKSDGGGGGGVRRGRSVAPRTDDRRNATAGRSLSRTAPTADRRDRSVSRGPASRRQFVNSESEVEQEQEDTSSVRLRNRSSLTALSNNPKREFTSRSSFDLTDRSLANLRTPNGEDSISVSSLSEVEEKTIKAVSEQMKSFHRGNLGTDASNDGIYETVRSEVRRAIAEIQSDHEIAIRRSSLNIATASVTDIPPDLVKPGAVELVQDIRREYAKKLEESQERARQLRADLAVEEHRELELGRILKEMLPEPKSSNGPKSRTVRKNSLERRKISNSKRLTEEAMAYFDECVSLSTFDSSDFSSPEDPPVSLVGFTTPVSDSAMNFAHSRLNDKQDGWSTAQSRVPLHQSASSITNESILDRVNLQQDILKYVKKVSTGWRFSRPRNYDTEDYAKHESLLFEHVLMKNRLESGCLLLCGAISFSPFAL